ncbi:hypothetical protein GOC74_00925 [Halomicrobium mukohataei]|uniref:Uncharacterized protein n=1 Tax=Halomicrobium mukohataei TaxID=57705 RepID=A0A847U663_9EURY|nr:hypothetical protein [Halomicrobium mukohataei]NLV08499.1 hypothetical protein [Halomicrobium mukohataei]
MSPERTAVGWARPRLWLVGSAAGVGVVVGPLAAALFAALGHGTGGGVRTAFSLGALALGFAAIGWSGSIFDGSGIASMQRSLDVSGNWTESDSRRAMGRIAGFGAGLMVAASGLEAALV